MSRLTNRKVAVLISIKPKWCSLIAKGRKTLELRKTIPKLFEPFKVYIYETKAVDKSRLVSYVDGNEPCQYYKGEGKVIGEFICDYIMRHCEMANADIAEQQGCIKREKIYEYSGEKEVFGWHISDLKIFDKPRELSELRAICRHYDDGLCGDCEYYYYANNESYRCEECAVDGLKPIKRPPQSWCYVQEREAS